MLFPPTHRPASPSRVVITGAGIVTALGLDWESNAEGFRLGRTGFRPVTVFDASRQRVCIAAEVDLPASLPLSLPLKLNHPRPLKAPSPRPSPPMGERGPARRAERRLERAGRLLLLATRQAWQQAGWEAGEGGSIPFVLGTTSGGMSMGELYYRQAIEGPLVEKACGPSTADGSLTPSLSPREGEKVCAGQVWKRGGSQRGQPTRVLQYQAQWQALQVAEALGFSGPVIIVANACASGANAIGHAWELLRWGRAERALAGGYDALSHMVFAGFDSLQALSPTPCRPFDAHRDGLTLGEGAAILALETLAHARQRGAPILGEIVGYAATTDVHHITQPHPKGDAAFEAMSGACQRAGVRPDQIGYVNAHGTGTPHNDSAEALAINRWAGPQVSQVPVSSTKASIGHLLGAAGAAEVVICLMALRGQWLPPMTRIETPDPLCAFPLVREPAEARFEYALSNSFGFGGANATLVLRRWTET